MTTIISKKEPTDIEEYEYNILFFSSLVFITNIITELFNGYYLYSFLFCILTTTSLIVHSNDNIYTNIIDKLSVSSIALYGGYILYTKLNTDKYLTFSIIVFTFLFTIYFYIYGYITEQFCFCNDKNLSKKYHMILHIVGSIGHHFIIFL